MKNKTIKIMSKKCFICNSKEFKIEENILVNDKNFELDVCIKCKVGLVFDSKMDYGSYGGYQERGQDYYDTRLKKTSFFKKIVFYFLDKWFGKNANILDFGSGAGFFTKSLENNGFKNAYAYEISEKFRNIAKYNVKVKNQIEDLEDINGKIEFDFISMLDVIEHLPLELIDSIMINLVKNMKSGAILAGVTPNYNSLNIKLFGKKDPVVAPPSHLIYFNIRNLDKFLSKFDLQKKYLFTMGMSHNAFFRKNKFESSWVESPNKLQRPFSSLIKILFKLLGLILIPFNMGYHVYFIYQKN
jgi:2-polyprenyl-3-methyl-5-hydroxy-6-metoxy-1,4-benzoquinol methylase